MRVVITGASRGIGAALAAGYAADGWEVTGTTRTDPAPPGLTTLDVTDPASHARLAAGLNAAPLDVLICNAGVYLARTDNIASGFSAADWAESFATNVSGVFLTVQSLLPNLRAATAPRIAIIASQMGSSERAGGGSHAYRATKAAAVNLGRNLAMDLRPLGIAVGIYHPGWVRTDMGGTGADLDAPVAAAGLRARIAALTPDRSGLFETWDGQPIPF